MLPSWAAAGAYVVKSHLDASAFFDLEDFFTVDVSVAVELSAVSSEADFLVFLDFDAVELLLTALGASVDVSALFDFGFFAVDVSAGVELSAASVFFDLVDFLALEESAVAVSSGGVVLSSSSTSPRWYRFGPSLSEFVPPGPRTPGAS